MLDTLAGYPPAIEQRLEPEQVMILDIKTVEAILRKHWEMPGDLELSPIFGDGLLNQAAANRA